MKKEDVIKFFEDKVTEDCMLEEDKHMVGALSLVAGQCFFCNQKLDKPKVMTTIERWHTQATSMGGNEETYDVKVTTTTCPHCNKELNREVGDRTFVSKGWV